MCDILNGPDWMMLASDNCRRLLEVLTLSSSSKETSLRGKSPTAFTVVTWLTCVRRTKRGVARTTVDGEADGGEFLVILTAVDSPTTALVGDSALNRDQNLLQQKQINLCKEKGSSYITIYKIYQLDLHHLPIWMNSSLNASLYQPYKMGLENAEDMPIKWQMAKQILYISSVCKMLCSLCGKELWSEKFNVPERSYGWCPK